MKFFTDNSILRNDTLRGSIAQILFVSALYSVLTVLSKLFFTHTWYITDNLHIVYLISLFWGVYYISTRIYTFSISLQGYTILFSVICYLTFQALNTYYKELQSKPIISSVSKNWTIQGDTIRIEGRNFGPAHMPGIVFTEHTQFHIDNWNDNRVVVTQNIPTEYEASPLIICNYKDFCNTVSASFEVRDPSKVFQ